MGTHPIFESDFDCLTDYEIIDNACRAIFGGANTHARQQFWPIKAIGHGTYLQLQEFDQRRHYQGASRTFDVHGIELQVQNYSIEQTKFCFLLVIESKAEPRTSRFTCQFPDRARSRSLVPEY